ALVVAEAVVAAVLFPQSIGTILHRPGGKKTIGGFGCVPESSPTPAAVQKASEPVTPATVLSQTPDAAIAFANPPATDNAAVPHPSQPPAANAQQAQTPNEQPEAPATSNAFAAASPSAGPENSAANEVATTPPKGSEAAQPTTTDESSSRNKKRHVAST